MKPPVFAALDLAEALEKSRTENKLLLVDAAAEWCEPCKIMDQMTWSDQKVIEALAPIAIAIQIDVDKKAEDAARLKVESMPTVVAFKDGVELDRTVGLQGPDILLEWLAGLARGENAIQSFRREVAANPDDVALRMRFASRLREGGGHEEATTQYLWLWKHMLEKDPSMGPVRHSFLVGALEGLFAKHPPARAAFAELRDAAAPSVDAIDPQRTADWLSLNSALGEPNVTLGWYDANVERILADAHLRDVVGSEVIPLLTAADRWADVGRIYVDPLADLRQLAAQREEMNRQMSSDPGMPAAMLEQIRQLGGMQLRHSATGMVRALRAAGRADEAKAFVEEAQRLGIELE